MALGDLSGMAQCGKLIYAHASSCEEAGAKRSDADPTGDEKLGVIH